MRALAVRRDEAAAQELRGASVLVEYACRVVTKDEVIDAVCRKSMVTEESLTRCISEVRRALGEKPGDRQDDSETGLCARRAHRVQRDRRASGFRRTAGTRDSSDRTPLSSNEADSAETVAPASCSVGS